MEHQHEMKHGDTLPEMNHGKMKGEHGQEHKQGLGHPHHIKVFRERFFEFSSSTDSARSL